MICTEEFARNGYALVRECVRSAELVLHLEYSATDLPGGLAWN